MTVNTKTTELPAWQRDAEDPSEYYSCETRRGREFLIRLNTGSDPTLAIERFARENNIKYGKVHAAFMGGFKPCKYLMWAPDVRDLSNWHNECVATVENLSMLSAIGGMIGQRPTEDGGEETFVALHFVSGGAWDCPTFCGHLYEGTLVAGCMEVFITELLDIEVLEPVDLYGIAYLRPENWYRNIADK